jgi:simple sugar transport system permease protein
MDLAFVGNEVITRFIRDGILVLALILPIAAGMGINFAITIGAMATQVGLLTVIILRISGAQGLGLALLIAIGLSIVLGYGAGHMLNRARGKEMITTIIIGLLANGIYQFIFLVGYGTFIPAVNHEIVLSRGIGIRNMVDLASYRNLLDQVWMVKVGMLNFPLLMIGIVLLVCLIVSYFLRTPLGRRITAVGEDSEKAELLGIDVNRTRILAMVLSTVIASIGQLVFIQNIGMLNVYSAHLNMDVLSAAALLAGGATIKRARVRNAILGVFLFHSLFIVSPQAGQNLFGNAALGEYLRSFVAYGTIALALILNLQQSTVKESESGILRRIKALAVFRQI